MSTISLCMIVKNEEELLARCLESVKNGVDEIIIVDTGSTDKTIEIAKSFGAKVYEYAWTDSFADARNVAKNYATKEWIFQLDADEYLPPGEEFKLKQVALNAPGDLLSVKILNIDEKNDEGLMHRNARFFKNNPEFYYEGRLHEHVVQENVIIFGANVDINIVHTGYTSERITNRSKMERNRQLLMLDLKERPRDGFVLMNVANFYSSEGRYKEAQKYAENAFNIGEKMSYRALALFRLLEATFKLGEYEKMLRMARHGETIMNYTSRDILYYKALACMVLERYDEAEDYFNRRLKRTKEDEVIYIGDAAVQKQYGGMLVKNRQIDDGLKLMYNAAFSNKYNWNYVIGYFKEVSKYRTSAEVLSQVEALYQKNESKDRITAYVIGAFIRSLEVMNLYSSQVTITDRTLFDGMFLDMQKLGHLSNEEEITGKVKKGDAEASAVAILYVISHSNAEMERLLELDQTSKYVLQLLRGNEAKRPKRPHEKIVTSLIKELLLRKDVNLLNKLLDAELLDNLTTAKLLDEFGFDDAAVAYYVEEFKQKPNLSKVALRIATLLKGSGQEEEAQMFINFVNN